jgi:hypothetical protein
VAAVGCGCIAPRLSTTDGTRAMAGQSWAAGSDSATRRSVPRGTMCTMRASGFLMLSIAMFALPACRCDGPQNSEAPASTKPTASSDAVPKPSVRVDAGSPLIGLDGGDDETASEAVVRVKPLDFAPAKGSRYKPMKLREDGAVVRPDKTIAKIVDDELSDDDGSPIATFGHDGRITIAGSDITFRFNDKNELEGPSGLRISVADDGVPTVVAKANAAPDRFTGKFVDFDSSARRAALVMLAMHDLKMAARAANPDMTNDPKAAQKRERKERKKLERERRKEKKEKKQQARNKQG